MNRSHAMSKPAVYQIEIQGRIAVTCSARLEGMQITESQAADGTVRTTLVGLLNDQAALSGVLNTLYEFHTPLISVTCLESRD